MNVIQGIPVSSGVVIGHAFVLDDVLDRVPHHVVAEEAVPEQESRLDAALAQALHDLSAARDRAARDLGAEPAKIFAFHLGLLQDRSLIDPIRTRLHEERVTAAYAVAEAFRELAERFRAMGSDVFRQKATDVLDLEARVLAHLVGKSRDRLGQLTDPVIVIAHEITPTEAASLDVRRVLAFATDAGGRTGHTSIVAAALGIPVVVGCQSVTQHVNDGDQLIVDGKSGSVIIRPDDETVASYQRDMERLEGQRVHLAHLREEEPVTLDGTRISLLGNIEFAHEIDNILESGGDGVGLYRTEFLYMTSPEEPTEDELYETYRDAITRLGGRPLTIRTLDLGADKRTQSLALEPERNPFLGLRSIRYCLQNLPLFRTQLRAILRASAHGPLKIMFPLVSTLMELRQAMMVLDDVREECEEEGIEMGVTLPIGVMIEVPSAALMATEFAREVAFMSIGTNDLIQYTLAVDRGNVRVANLYSGANPAVLQLIKAVIRAGRRFGTETSLCGEIASDMNYTMLLLGLGLRTLSIVPSQIPAIKQVIRSVDIEQCERLARKVGSFHSERQILNCLRDNLTNVLPEATCGWSAD